MQPMPSQHVASFTESNINTQTTTLKDQRKHILALDGLRGVAFLLVFLLHTVMIPADRLPLLRDFFSLGHWGVDLFFCLSGFLITGILFAAKNSKRYFINFYSRRTLRIFPLYYFFLLIYWLLVVRLQVINFGVQKTLEAAADLKYVWWYGTTLRILANNHYISASLNHFWSLAVEEHFYLIWPLLIFWFSRKNILRAIGVIAIAALVLRIVMLQIGFASDVITTFTPGRVDSFCIGGAVSLLLLDPVWKARLMQRSKLVFWVFLILGLVCYFTAPAFSLTIGYSCIAICFASLIALATNEGSLPNRFLSNRFLRFFGKYSYSLYVFHWPIQIGIARFFPVSVLEARVHSLLLAVVINVLLVGAISVVVALLTWNLFEVRFLKLKRLFPEPAAS
jgi:peptidoglycan/LPS O-acetylase OafA/YrhL